MLIVLSFGLIAGDADPKNRNWQVTLTVLDTKKLLEFKAKLVSYDGLSEVRTVMPTGKRLLFSYAACSKPDQQYLDSLDAPVNFEAGIARLQTTVWYYPDTPGSSAEKRLKWAEGAFYRGLKEGAWTRWWPNQAIKSRGNYSVGRKTGIWEYRDEQGRLIDSRTFSDEGGIVSTGKRNAES